MKSISKLALVLSAVGTAALAFSTADAAILHYSFDPGSYYDFSGGSSNVVTGSFDYNTIDGSFSNVYYDRGGTIFTTAIPDGPGAGPDQAFFGDVTSADYDVYQFANDLADGGTDVITGGYHPSIVIDAGGSVSVSGLGPAVPEPAAWALMLVGFGLGGGFMRRRRAVAAA